MSSVSGAKVTIAGFTETAFKDVGGTPSGERMYVTSFGLRPSQPRIESEIIAGLRGRPRSALGQKSIAGTISTELSAESIPFHLKHLIGVPTTAGVNPYTHTFAAGSGANALPPGASFEIDFTDAIGEPGRYMVYKGCRYNQGTITINANGMITAAFDVLGADWDADNTDPLDATLTDPGHTSFSSASVAIVLSDGSPIEACFQQITITWNNNLDDSQYCISGGGVRDALDEGLISLTGQVTSLFDSEALLNKILADTDCSLEITCSRGTGDGSDGNEKVVFTIPALAFEITAPTVEGPRGLTLQANWSAHRTSGELGASVVVYNARATV